MTLSRRPLLLGAAAAIGLPRFAIGQSDQRPAISIAVQKIANTNTLEVLREQSNVGERIFFSSLWEGLIGRDWLNELRTVPMLATAWRRVSDSVVELTLRENVRFHDGATTTAEDVAFSFGRNGCSARRSRPPRAAPSPSAATSSPPRPRASCRWR